MRKFLSNKLWRDKMIDIVQEDGSRLTWKYLDDKEYDLQLREKILEEAQEVYKAETHKELIEELADVVEVIDALCILHGINKEEINKDTREEKERAWWL